jgi:hypothetical protein
MLFVSRIKNGSTRSKKKKNYESSKRRRHAANIKKSKKVGCSCQEEQKHWRQSRDSSKQTTHSSSQEK